MGYTQAIDFKTRLALGQVSGHSVTSAVGEMENTTNTITGEDIWRGNELSNPQISNPSIIPIPAIGGELMSVFSEDSNDSSGSTGVRTIRMHVIIPDGTESEVDVTMNGTTPVNIGTSIRFVQEMHSLTVGANGAAEGNIRIQKTSDPQLVYNMIYQGANKSMVARRMVPLGHTILLERFSAEEAQGKKVSIRLESTDDEGEIFPGIFIFRDVHFLNKMSTGSIMLNYPVPELSIIRASVWSATIDSKVTCSWGGQLIENN